MPFEATAAIVIVLLIVTTPWIISSSVKSNERMAKYEEQLRAEARDEYRRKKRRR